MTKYKFGLSEFVKPTPKNIARFGLALFSTCSVAAGTFVYFNEHKAAMVIGVIGIVGLFLSNFFGNGIKSNQEDIHQ
jgi:hypothetical protein